MDGALVMELHALVLRLDRAAERILRDEKGISYRRFLALFMVAEFGPTTQRALSRRLDISEPSVSRMAGVLAASGLLAKTRDPQGGNRYLLALTPDGTSLVDDCRTLLSDRFSALVESSGIPAESYVAHTRALSALLDDSEGGE